MRLPKLETGGETVSTKAFPGIERLIGESAECGNCSYPLKEAKAELANARSLVLAVSNDPHIKSVQVHQALAACVSPQAMEQK